MAFDIVTVAGSIAALVIPRVTIHDLSQTRDAVDPRECPVFRPYPQAGFEITEVPDESFGSRSAAKNILYTVTYALYYAPVDNERGLEVILSGMWQTASDVMTVLIANDTIEGAVDMRPTNVRQAGTLLDPADNAYHGVLFTLAVLEFAQ